MKLTPAAVAALALLGAAALTAGPAPAAQPRAPIAGASCLGPASGTAFTNDGNARYAQTFTVETNGTATGAQVAIYRGGTAGDFVVELVAVNHSGIPTNTILASATLLDASLPSGPSIQEVSFAVPAAITAGQQYAVLVTRPGSSLLGVGVRTLDDCAGALFISSDQTAQFDLEDANDDLVFTLLVEPAPDAAPPETTITKGPRSKTKRRSANFAFSSSEAGSTFTCSLDGAPFEPCSSPKDYDKLKRKRHHFEVVATDPAGNADSSPATFDWKVKKGQHEP